MFKFKGISSKDMQVVVEEEEHFIAKASQRYEMTEIEGRDGAIFDELGYSVVERPIYVQCLNINKIDDILAWLNGEGEFEYKGRKTTARFYSQLEPQRSSCIRIIDTTFIRDPFWCKVNEDYQLVKDRKDKKASGEYIHVEDSSNCRAKINIGGNHEQETRAGYNLLNFDVKQDSRVTYNNEDGTITINGQGGFTLAFKQFTAKANTKYYIKWELVSGTVDTSKSNGNSFLSSLDNKNIKQGEFKESVVESDKDINGFWVNNMAVFTNTVIKFWANTNKSDFEQYGASPSPDYKSEIESVGSNVNEFDIAAVKDGFLNEKTGEIISNNSWKCSDFIEILNKTYTFGWESSSDYFQVTVCYYDENKKFISGKSYGLRGTFNNTFEIVSNAKYMKIAYSVSVRGESVTREKIKLEKGTVATPWSQHGQGCVKVTKCNKNLFDKDKALQKYELNRTTGQIKSNDLFFTSDYIRVSPNKQYFLSGKNDGESNCFYDKNKKYIDAVVLKNGLLTVPDNSNIYYLRLNSRLTAIDTTMLEKNTKKSAYEEHQGQSYIMPTQQSFKSVGDIRDTFIKKDGKWYERHNIYRYLFTGNENFKALDNNSIFGMRVTENKAKIVSKNSGENLTNCLSNRFVNNTQSNTAKMSNKIAFSQWSDAQFLYLSKIKDSVGELKSYLAANETYVDYPLETPIDIECTEEQSKILDELNNARTYKNVTNITTDSKAILSLDYFTVTDEKIKNEGNVQSRPILRLEKTVSEAVDITINGVRFKYNFNNDKYVEIDCENKEVKFDGLERFRSIEIGYDFPKLNIGNNEITINDGDCIIKVIRKDRWL